MSDTNRCSECERVMRPFGAHKEDHPGTVARATNEVCQTCYARRGGRPKDLPSDEPCVPVRSLFRPSTYRVFRDRAAELGVGVDVLLSRLADHAAGHRKPKRKRAEDFDAAIREMNAAGENDSEIARVIGMSSSAVSTRRGQLGLEKRTTNGRKKKAS